MEIQVGAPVKIVVKHQFKEPQLGIVISKNKDGLWVVYVADPNAITKTATIDPARGDQITLLKKK